MSEGREFYSQTSRGSAVGSVPDGRASAVVVHCSLDLEPEQSAFSCSQFTRYCICIRNTPPLPPVSLSLLTN